MRKIYIFIVSIICFLSFTIIYDLTLFFSSYNELINIQESVCYIVSNSGGITFELKEFLNKKDIKIEYEKSDDINGATFEFALIKEIEFLLINNDKYIRLDLVVILGY